MATARSASPNDAEEPQDALVVDPAPRLHVPGLDTSAIPDDLARLIAANQQLAASQTDNGQLIGNNELIGLPTGGGGEVVGLATSPSSPDFPESPDFRGADRRRGPLPALARSVLVYAAVCGVLGVVGGLIWHSIVQLPEYVVGGDGVASMTERGIAQVAGTDAWYSAVGVVGGLVLGVLGWIWFNRLGWPSTVLVALGGMASAVVAWVVGEAMGPRNFDQRITAAHSGDRLPIDFQLHMHSAILVWVAAAILPVLLNSSLRPDVESGTDEAPRWERVRGLSLFASARGPAGEPPTPGSSAEAELSARDGDDRGVGRGN